MDRRRQDIPRVCEALQCLWLLSRGLRAVNGDEDGFFRSKQQRACVIKDFDDCMALLRKRLEAVRPLPLNPLRVKDAGSGANPETLNPYQKKTALHPRPLNPELQPLYNPPKHPQKPFTLNLRPYRRL